MGGKNKQSQRTKNNARPSSSGRSAELLNNAVNLESWNSPGGGKMASLFPTLTSPIIDQGLTAEFSVCIKKLNKKDPITRTKALQELTELVGNSKVDDVAAALPSWAHFYKILAVDTDCKVREAAQACHGAIARACGRRLAPVLRQVVPAWLQAQYDDHAPAMTHATNSLKATFPENKLPEVISFCKVEVVSYFLENLTGSGDKTILNRIEDPSERELQQQRLVCGSLQGLRFLARHVPAAHQDWLAEQLAPLLASNAYWKLAGHTSPQIRGAWFGAMGSMLERFGLTLGEAACARCARLLLLAARDQPPGVAHQLWGCLLALMYSVPDWHKWLDKKDLLTKRILDMLEKGGWGDARRLSDLLLPLLAHLPADMLTRDFYEAFFGAFDKGLDKKSILSSNSERQYWITSLSECLRYLTIQPHDFVVEVATAVHRTWLKRALSVEHESQLRTNLVKHSATSMAALVKYWLKQSKEPNGEKYDQLVRNFWQNVASTMLSQIDQSVDVEKVTPIIDGHILLVQTLRTAFLNEGKKPMSIKFDGDAPSEAVKPAPVQEIDAASIERYKHNLNDTVEKLCCGYFELADKKEIIEVVLTPLITILNEFDSKSLYLALAKHFEASGVYELYDKVLRRWMVTDTTRCKPVVDVIFILMKHLTEEEQDAVLTSFDQFPVGALEWCVSCALCHVQWRVAAVRRWLHSGTVEKALLALVRRLLQQCCARAKNLLFVCLSHDAGAARGEMMISTATAMRIAQQVSFSLRARLHSPPVDPASCLDLEHVGSVAAHLATALAAAPAHDSYLALVLDLFELVVLVPRGNPRLSLETWREVRSGVHDGACAAPPAARARLLASAADVLRKRLLQLDDTVNTTAIENMLSLCPPLVLGKTRAVTPEVQLFCEQLLNPAEWKEEVPVEVFALRYDCIVGNLNCPVDDDNEFIKKIVQESASGQPTELTKEGFISYANRLLFRAIYLRTLLLHKKSDDDDDDDDEAEEEEDNEQSEKNEDSKQDDGNEEAKQNDGNEETKQDDGNEEAKQDDRNEVAKPQVPAAKPAKTNLCNEFLKEEYFQEEFCKVIHDYAVVVALKNAYGFWLHNDLIQETRTKLSQIIQAIIESTSEDIRESILSRLVERSLSLGYYWAFAKSYYETDIGKAPEGLSTLPANVDADKMESILTGNGFFHTLQADVERQTDETVKLQVNFALMMRCLLLAHGPDDTFAAQALAACGPCSLEPVVAFYHQHQERMLYERSINELSWQACLAEAAVATCVAATLRLQGWEAPAHHWDFATVGLCTLLEALGKDDIDYACTKVNVIAHAAFKLYQFVEEYIGNIRAECERRQPQPHVLQLVSEWQDVFAPALNRDLYRPAVRLLEKGSNTISSGLVRTLASVNEALRQADWRLIDAAHRNNSLSLERLTGACCAALARPLHPAYHCLAYGLLLRLADPLSQHSEDQLKAWSELGSEEGEARARPLLASDWFREHFSRAIELADAALSGHTAGADSCEMAPGSDAYSLALGCLLLAEALHQLTARAKGELQHHYIQAYRENKYTEQLLPTALRLLPGELLRLAAAPAAPALPPRHADAFQRMPQFRADDWALWRCIGQVSCRALSTCVAGAGGAGARGWWGAAGRPARALSRLVAAYVAPALVRRQLEQLLARKHELEDTEVTVHWTSNEAGVVYRVEDRPVELWVKFEADFPLSLPRVTAPTVRPAVTTSWIAMFIAYQNGTVLNAVKMWTAAISSQVESSPQCYVCYCRLHPATGHLPQVRCHQCRNRFHTACLHKWFVSSHKSNCPLCRSNF